MNLQKLTAPLFAVIPLYAFLLALFPPAVERTRPAVLAMNSSEETRAPSALPPRRVVIFPPILWSYLTIDEGTAHVLAIARYLHMNMAEGLLGRVYPDAVNIQVAPTVGENSAIPGDTESVMLFKPDTVFSWSWFSEPLKAVRLPGLIDIDYDRNEPDRSDLAIWNLVGRVTHKSERGDALLRRYFDKRESLQRMLPTGNTQRLRVAILSSYGDYHFMIGKKDYLDDRLRSLGAEICADSRDSSLLDPEELISLDPDIILLMSYEDDVYFPQSIYQNAEYRSLRAVRDHRVYKMPSGGSRMEGPVEEPLLLLWMAELFHPTNMPRRLRNELKETYQEVYRYELSDDEIDRTLFLKENMLSVGYDRFARAGTLP
jgi:iron complex transport system substrate-binding protein